MADETQPDPNAQPPANGKNKGDGAPDPNTPVQKFRVLHAAVSGFASDKDGKRVDCDHFSGAIVTAAQLGGNEAHYLVMGAIAPLDA